MVEKESREGVCNSIYRYAKKKKNKCIKDYDKNKKLSYIQYSDRSNLYGCTMSQKFPLNKFEWIENTSHFNEDFIKNCNEESDEGYFL